MRVPEVEPVAACPVCGATDRVTLFDIPDFLHGVPGTFRYDRCGRCSSVYQNPRVRDDHLDRCYPVAYYTHEASPAVPGESTGNGGGFRGNVRRLIIDAVRGTGGGLTGRLLALSRFLRERAFRGLIDPLIPRSPNPGRALEVGPGAGWELGLLAWAGWRVEGVEWDAAAAESAKKTSGCTVHSGDFLSIELPRDAFSLIYLGHVFEHLADPQRVMAFLSGHLAPGGRAVLVYPNSGSLGARLFGCHWWHWDAPRHLVFPRSRAVHELASRAGLRARTSTRARGALQVMRESRRRRSGGWSAAAERPVVSVLQAMAEAVLVTVGIGVGEEMVTVLFKP